MRAVRGNSRNTENEENHDRTSNVVEPLCLLCNVQRSSQVRLDFSNFLADFSNFLADFSDF